MRLFAQKAGMKRMIPIGNRMTSDGASTRFYAFVCVCVCARALVLVLACMHPYVCVHMHVHAHISLDVHHFD